jgi:hypothetical protein
MAYTYDWNAVADEAIETCGMSIVWNAGDYCVFFGALGLGSGFETREDARRWARRLRRETLARISRREVHG